MHKEAIILALINIIAMSTLIYLTLFHPPRLAPWDMSGHVIAISTLQPQIEYIIHRINFLFQS